ncbi:MAG: glycoside hydrolase family 10 protein [Phycisphaerales bacterium]
MRAMNRRDACRVIAAAPLLGTSLTACGASNASRRAIYSPSMPPREFRGVWVATVDNIDWPSQPGLSTLVQKQEIDRILDECLRLELNAIFLQVRPTCDALYKSDNEPWSAFLTGSQGTAPNPQYDPLEYWVRGAHNRGIDIHAWVNPFRARHPKSVGPDSPSHVVNRHPDITRDYRGHLWLDPGAPKSRELAMGVIADLLNRYDIDGIHMDDYFYPYPDKDKPFPDDATFADYKQNGGTLLRDDWRRDNINQFVREVNELVHRANPGRLFTISPFGIWRPGHPKQVVGFDAYAGLYADAKHWMQQGWCDAMIPQLYWKIESKGQPFEPLLDWWTEQNTRDRHLWAGIYLTRIKPDNETGSSSWDSRDIIDQIELVQRKSREPGFALFSMVGMLENRRGIADQLAAGPMSGPALVPESPWLNAPQPGTPRGSVEQVGAGYRLTLEPAAGPVPTRRYVAGFEQVAGKGSPGWVIPAGPGRIQTNIIPTGQPNRNNVLSVVAIGPNGIAGGELRFQM